MTPGNFEYHAPSSLADVLALLKQYGDEGKILAGGHSLLPMMKLRLASPGHLVDLRKVPGLTDIQERQGIVHIGAMVTEAQLIRSDVVKTHCPLIAEAASVIADPQVRNCGTIGGDLAHGDPGNDQPAVMLALDADLVIHGARGERVVAARDFFLGTYLTALEAGDVLTEIRIPIAGASAGQAYSKLKRKIGDFATAAVAVSLRLKGDKCQSIGIALTNAGPVPTRVGPAEKILVGQVINEDLIAKAAVLVMAACDPAVDLRGDAEYKTHMAGEMMKRALRRALKRAKGEE
ncbi:MAG: FAD binding domain-containing protein [Acidiferrobacter sp.]